jgi:hypothetical protein
MKLQKTQQNEIQHKEKNTSHHTHIVHKRKLYFRIQNGIIRSVMIVHKVQQFHQNNFSTPDDGHVGQNMV